MADARREARHDFHTIQALPEKMKLIFRQHPGYSTVAVVTAAYLSIMFFVCRVQWAGFATCADSFDHLHLALYAPSGVIIAAKTLISIHRRPSPRVPLHYTGIIAILAVLASLAMSPMPSMQHNMAMFCFTAVAVWASLSLVKQTKWALLGWLLIVGFLVFVALHIHVSDSKELFLYLCALFAAGTALYKTGLDRLGECVAVATCCILVVTVVDSGAKPVDDLGMPQPYVERSVTSEYISLPSISAGPAMVVVEGFLGIMPIIYLVARMNYRRM